MSSGFGRPAPLTMSLWIDGSHPVRGNIPPIRRRADSGRTITLKRLDVYPDMNKHTPSSSPFIGMPNRGV
jgi:hypothetical protein